MRKLLLLALLLGCSAVALADDNAYFKVGPLDLNIPLKTVRAVYLYDFKANQNLVGAETPVLTLWNKVDGVVGVITSLQGQGSPLVGGNVLIGNLLDKWITLPQDFSLGAFGAWDFRNASPAYGVKASTRIWG